MESLQSPAISTAACELQPLRRRAWLQPGSDTGRCWDSAEDWQGIEQQDRQGTERVPTSCLKTGGLESGRTRS